MNDKTAVIIGAGISGLYQLHRLLELGLSVQVLEAGDGVGGTWYWNRYPGARFDSESYSYGYSFSRELLEEWDWSEHFASQPETLRYLNYVADKFRLRDHIRFSSRVTKAHWHEDRQLWEVTAEDGYTVSARFLITALGPLSAPTKPKIDGIDTFAGEAYQTSRWPHHDVSFAGKRVGVIGTGATGIQTITEVAKTAGDLTVFQRTPNWAAPLHNAAIDAASMRDIRARYPEIFERCRQTFAGFLHTFDERSVFDVPPDEREAFFEKLYGEPGFGIWQGTFRDVLRDRDANALMSDFAARKIRERVRDPETAEALIPTNHGFGTRRVPLESGYYEVYNQDNVHLVNLRETPIVAITPAGVKTTEADIDLDMLIYATGFDAITGSFDRIDFRGAGGLRLVDAWRGEPRTYLGVLVRDFPNLMMLMGPHSAFGNIPRSIEYNVDWVTALIEHARSRGSTRVEPTEEGMADWTEHVREIAAGVLANEVDSWMTGVNTNVEGKAVRAVIRYSGSGPAYRARCEEARERGYPDIQFA